VKACGKVIRSVVHAFRTATEYITNTGSDRIACVILDLNLPDISGLEVQNRLADQEGPPVLFVTAHGDLNSGVRAMKNGAIDFMIEPIDYNRLLAAVETAFAKDRNKRRERVERLSLLKRWNSLTPREQDVFQYTVSGFLNRQAAGELGITENTFQVHRGRVMRKMKADSLAELVRMSTRLESIARSLRGNEITTQSLKTILKGLVEENPIGASAATSTHHSYANRVSSPDFDRIGKLRYAESRQAWKA
jgi:FixJ family two-component response regulator